jgi:hypothetical protein
MFRQPEYAHVLSDSSWYQASSRCSQQICAFRHATTACVVQSGKLCAYMQVVLLIYGARPICDVLHKHVATLVFVAGSMPLMCWAVLR